MRTVFLKMLAVVLVLTMAFSIWIPVSATENLLPDEDGYDLWLRYAPIADKAYATAVGETLQYIVVGETGEVITTAMEELRTGLDRMLSRTTRAKTAVDADGGIVLGTADDPIIQAIVGADALAALGEEGYLLKSAKVGGKKVTVIASGGENGVLYGTFKLLEMIQCGEDVDALNYTDAPKIRWRVLDQWDNWDGSIERGYAGRSIYNWAELPTTVDGRYADFARANASVGINTIVINNVNTQLDYIKSENLPKIKAIADVFRKYGIRLALTVRFDSPMRLPGADGSAALTTSDPLNEGVIRWWDAKFDEIYRYIPDFAGILVKADSEGQPGPSQYGRTHADGANMLAGLLKEHNDAVVMWRAFVYGAAAQTISSDIVLHSYGFFKPLDGQFDDNVILQSKNGPRDFLPREPVSPVFGGMKETNMGLELQITQEYTGQSTDLCYLIPMWKYYLDTDMMLDDGTAGVDSTLSQIVQGNLYDQSQSLIAGVSNVGNETNWNRLLLAQANWYGFGKLAWNPDCAEDEITNTWVKLTFGTDEAVVDTVGDILAGSWEIYQAYTSPYAMGMTQDVATHLNPDLDYRNGKVISVDATGVGNNRNSTGSTNAAAQYSEALGAIYNDIDTCPEELLCWFHHVPYGHVLSNGKTIIRDIYDGITQGPKQVLAMKAAFAALAGKIDNARFEKVLADFDGQYAHAITWKNAMLAFFEEQSGIPAAGVEFTNLALGKTAFASQERIANGLTLTADKAIDGKSDTRWGTNQTDENHYLAVDLGSVMKVNRVELSWENFSSRYVIEVATELTTADGSNPTDWTVVAEGKGNEWSRAMSRAGETTLLFADTDARYIRMRTLEKNSGLWNSVYEFQVYGDELAATARYVLGNEVEKAYGFLNYDCTKASLDRLAAAITVAEAVLADGAATDEALLNAVLALKAAWNEMQFDDLARGRKIRHNTVNGANHSGNMLDGKADTYWQAGNDAALQAVLEIDFRDAVTFDQVAVQWKTAAARFAYSYENEAGEWVELGQYTHKDPTDTLTLDAPVTARKFRLTTLERRSDLSIYTLSIHSTAPRFEMGDVDMSGTVDVADIMKLKALIMADEWSDEELTVGDMDASAKLDVGDIMAVKNVIMSK